MPYSDGARQLDVTKRVLSPSAAPRLRWQEEGARDGRNNRVELDRRPLLYGRHQAPTASESGMARATGSRSRRTSESGPRRHSAIASVLTAASRSSSPS